MRWSVSITLADGTTKAWGYDTRSAARAACRALKVKAALAISKRRRVVWVIGAPGEGYFPHELDTARVVDGGNDMENA